MAWADVSFRGSNFENNCRHASWVFFVEDAHHNGLSVRKQDAAFETPVKGLGFPDSLGLEGMQPERLGGSPVYLMPNPSGLNASTSLDDLIGHLQTAMAGQPSTTRD